jgi:formate hydrogenlyase subunit 4
MIGYVLEVTQAALALLLAPGLVGLIRWMKARLQNRRGAPVWQPYWELAKLFQKEVIVSRNASWLFRAAPFIVFASTVAVTFLVPILAVPLPFDGVGDLLVVVYLLLLGNLFVPWGVSVALTPAALAVALVSLLAKLVVLAGTVAVLETRIAKLRLFRVPELLSASFVLALLAVTSSFLLR